MLHGSAVAGAALSITRKIRKAIPVGAAAGFLVGMFDGVLAVIRGHEGVRGLVGALMCAALFAAPGAVLGIALGCADFAAERLTRAADGRLGGTAEPDRVLRASLLPALCLLALGLLSVVTLGVRMMLTLQTPDFAAAALVLSAFVLLVLGVQAILPLSRWFAVLVARWTVPGGVWERHGKKVAVALTLLITILPALYFIAVYGDISIEVTLGFYFLLTLILAAPALRWQALDSRRGAWGLRITGAILVILWLLSARVVSASPSAQQVVTSSVGAGKIAEWLASASDFDGDGASSFFGGSDCAPFDRSRAPTIAERPGNGKDEDCDGRDGAKGAASRVAPISGLLPKHSVGGYNVILIVVDALRWDRLDITGYERRLTSEIDRLVRESLFFNNAKSQSSTTRISFPSFLSGRLPMKLRWEKAGPRHQIADSEVMVQEVLRKRGYSTAFIGTAWFKEHISKVLRGFDHYGNAWFDGDYTHWRKASAPVTTTRAIEFIERTKSPFFLAAYYEGPHPPYENQTERGVPSFGSKPVDRYDQEVYYSDKYIGFLLDYLRAKPEVWDQTVVIVIGDHGEEFGEHGGKHHSRTCYVESLRVPLVLRVPGFSAEVFDAPVALVDIVPTLLELVGEGAEGLKLDGRSLFYPVFGKSDAARPIFCGIFGDKGPEKTFLRSVRSGPLAFISKPQGAGEELYDTNSDPREQHNVIGNPQYRTDSERLRSLLSRATTAEFGP